MCVEISELRNKLGIEIFVFLRDATLWVGCQALMQKIHSFIEFKPGFTTKNRGWGLGLSLSKRIIEQYHKGEIFVRHSELGKGSTFRIILKK